MPLGNTPAGDPTRQFASRGDGPHELQRRLRVRPLPRHLKRQGTDVDLEMIFRGVLDGIGGVSPRVTFKEMRPTLRPS